MLARWWLVLQAEVKSLCGHRKEQEDGSVSIRPAPPQHPLSAEGHTGFLRAGPPEG